MRVTWVHFWIALELLCGSFWHIGVVFGVTLGLLLAYECHLGSFWDYFRATLRFLLAYVGVFGMDLGSLLAMRATLAHFGMTSGLLCGSFLACECDFGVTWKFLGELSGGGKVKNHAQTS